MEAVHANDWPNATSVDNTKDTLESRLNDLVCSGRFPLAVAQEAIARNWVSANREYDS